MRNSQEHDLRSVIREALRLLRPFWLLASVGTGIGVLSGFATAWLLAKINLSLHNPEDAAFPLLASFGGLCALSIIGTAISGALNSIVGQKLIAALRKEISARILRAPIAVLEAHRAHRLVAVLTNDVDTVSVFTFNISGYAIALAVTIGSFVYLFILSPIVFVIAVASLAVGIVINIIAKRGWIRDYEGVRVAQDELHRQYRAITEGAKELKISRPRRNRIFGILLTDAADRIAALKSRAMRLFWIADAGGSAVFFVVIGLLLACQRKFGIDAAVISGAVIVLLYIKGPITQLASALPALDQARISFKRIAELSVELDRCEPNIPLTAAETNTARQAIGSIELRHVTYAFPAKGDVVPFVVGPVDLTVYPGELLFIVGENGSGKTTLIKLLLGLYAPQQGSILLDGELVTAERRDDYRQLFTTIFSDYYLFDDLAYGALPSEAQPHLDQLGIAHKVRLDGDHFTTTDLSTGQRKRLALVQAYLEGRPVIVFDEWAAEQDPTFRRIFYNELLPDLKRQGKSVVVITHDDRYFEIADRIVWLEAGKIIEIQDTRESAAFAPPRAAQRTGLPTTGPSLSPGLGAANTRGGGTDLWM
ncbi:cyclic peptide export ABC transporter [Chelatococcus sp. GCM10030263]|uniref:cyclic peptide export ABC transporter n=1 Tax=Chelatococcus sp. GCM10030263 TaxID=3273387 RepID=UPI00360F7075